MSQVITEQSNGGAFRAKDAARFLGIGQSTFWRWAKEGRVPRGKRLTPGTTVWLRADLERILAEAK